MMKIKWMAMALGLGLVATGAQGSALVTQGANELAISGMVDFQSDMGVELDLNVRYAYFLIDRVAIGTKVLMYNNDTYNHFGLGLTGEYNFKLPQQFKPLFGTDLVPFLGGAVDFRHTRIYGSKESAVVFGGEGGVKFFLTDTAAVTTSVLGELATEDIFADDGEATNLDLRLLVGMRFYF